MVYNKIYAQIGEERHIVLDPINYQYDIKQILVIQGETVPEYYEADICNVGDTATLTMVGTAADGVEIPDKFLRDGRNVLVYVVIPGSGGDVQTRYDITIPVDERAEREDIDPSEAEQQQIDSLVAALNSGVGRAEAAAEAIQDMDVEAETLAAGSAASVEKTVDPETGAVTLNFGIPQGQKGNPGTPGQDGVTPDFRIGSVETLKPGQSATATITGTPAQPVLNLGIPQGPKGDSGASDAGEVTYDPTETYQSGTAGAALNDLSYAIKEKMIGLDSLMNLSWEAGTINGTSGQDAAGSSRFRCVEYLPINAFFKYENNLGLYTRVFAYSESFSYLGAMGSGMELTYYTKQDVLTNYPLCKYVRFVFQTDTLTDVTNNTRIYGTETYYKSVKSYDIGLSIINPSGYEYQGERITLNRNRVSYAEYDAFTGYGQDAIVYGDYGFLFKPNKALIRRLSTKANIASQDLPVSAHCNSAVWGNKYDSGDVFPLIYVNAYNADGVANGVCYVFRVTTRSNGVPNGLTLVQTITIGFANTEPWTDGNDVRPYGNFFVDTVNGFLWAYTLKDSANVTRFFKFSLPSVSSATITITTADILEQFDVQYMPYIQGNTYNDGKVYVVSGYGTTAYPGMLNAVSLVFKAIVTQINLYNIGIQVEPEFIDVIDGSIVLGKTTAYKFTF